MRQREVETLSLSIGAKETKLLTLEPHHTLARSLNMTFKLVLLSVGVKTFIIEQ